MDPGPVAAQDVPRIITAERPRRHETEERMDAELLARSPEIANGAERVGNDEGAKLRDPGRDLPPEARARDWEDLERRGDDPLHGHRVVRDAERRGHLGAVAGVAIEELDHAGRLAELRDPLERGLPQGGVEDPDLAAALERV